MTYFPELSFVFFGLTVAAIMFLILWVIERVNDDEGGTRR